MIKCFILDNVNPMPRPGFSGLVSELAYLYSLPERLKKERERYELLTSILDKYNIMHKYLGCVMMVIDDVESVLKYVDNWYTPEVFDVECLDLEGEMEQIQKALEEIQKHDILTTDAHIFHIIMNKEKEPER